MNTERTLNSKEVIEALKIPTGRFYKALAAGQVPHTIVSPKKKLFNLDEARASLGKPARPVDDENHPEHDAQDADDEQRLTECQEAAFEASQEAATGVFLDYIQRARKQKNRPLLKRLVSALSSFQANAGQEEE